MVKYSVLRGFYEIERTIGCGGFAKVKLATHLATGEKVAIKIMEKSSLKDDLPRVKVELKALKNLSHEHICKLYQVIETETHYFIVMEYCSGGELFDHIVEKCRLTESESRMFFRQIVSAVAYLHSLGYAHRDLKPENVLLDKDQNLKLIDFGLCARPEGGVQNPLFTSCGSPTYAAPELVLGKQYLGPEVDVWAMGVLLYTLLAGFLPFSDDTIDNLYKKILSGKYEEPHFMSQDSKKLIRQMLQIDPKKRITVRELLSHPWLTLGVLNPVEYNQESRKNRDEDCISVMAHYHCVSNDEIWRGLKKWKYDYNTATYLLLQLRKKRNLPLKISCVANRVPIARLQFVDSGVKTQRDNILRGENVKNNLTPSAKREEFKLRTRAHKKNCVDTPIREVFDNFQSPRLNLNEEHLMSPMNFFATVKPLSSKKPFKRLRSSCSDCEASPVPVKKSTPGPSIPKTPECASVASSTNGSARKVLGSIEKSLHKVRHVLIPKKSSQDTTSQPVLLNNKDLCNVSTTQSTDPELVMAQLSKALEKKGIMCWRKGFTLRGKLEQDGGCSFELEICYLPTMGGSQQKPPIGPGSTKPILRNGVTNNNKTLVSGNVEEFYLNANENFNRCNNSGEPNSTARVGIRRNRLKGDAWLYKKVCEQVLALTATELVKPEESSV